MSIIYLDRLSFFSLFAVIRSKIDYSELFYFDISKSARTFSDLFFKLGWLKVKPQLAEFRLGDIRDKKGECQFPKIYGDITATCFEISDKSLSNNSFLKMFKNDFDFRKLIMFFEKIVYSEIEETILFINAAKWHSESKGRVTSEPIVYFLEKGLWSQYLSSYGTNLSLKVVQYTSLLNVRYIDYFFQAGKNVLAQIKRKTNTLQIVKKRQLIEKLTSRRTGNKPPLIGAWYAAGTVTFSLTKRSYFFWLINSEIPREQVLVYFDRKDVPATKEMGEVLTQEGVKFTALSDGARTSNKIPVHKIGRQHKKLLKYHIKLVLKHYFLCTVRLKKVPIFYLLHILWFVNQYSYWYDFFSSHNIKINVSPSDFVKMYLPKNLALEKYGGVSISYHWANLWFAHANLSNCSDVMFSFSPSYQWIWKNNRSSIGNIVCCGYITDYSFKSIRNESIKLREGLLKKGVKFIICFFDENSSHGRQSIISHEKSASTYKYFIEKALTDETLGLIFKPGYPSTLYKRISSIANLVKQANDSGRVIFLDKGNYVSENYPTEAAQASDLCIGLLLSGTVALESYLSGIPTIFLDLEKLYSNPVYQLGPGKIVFDNLDDLFSVVKKYRENKGNVRGFGDLSTWARDKDCFRDGNASLRMGQYINWLLEKFNEGKTREKAIEYANQKYAQYWGRENVIG